MTEPTEPEGVEPEDTEPESELVPLESRLELLSHREGIADVIRWVDPEDEGPGRPAGVETCEPVALLDLFGHIHPPLEVVEAGLAPECIPATAPFRFGLELLDELIEGLQEARTMLVARLDEIGQDR
jgi:hypothetical protein